MIFDKGVNLGGVTPELSLGLVVANEVYALYGANMVITYILDGNHKPNSLHYEGRAADLRTHNIPDHVDKQELLAELRNRLGPDFDVLLEDEGNPNEHIHIEFHPEVR